MFWGFPGSRRRVCQAGAWFHFIADVDGEDVQTGLPDEKAVGPGDPVQMTPDISPVQLTLGGGLLIPQRPGGAR
jgi:hypothetical protein